jgi:predicted ATPase
MGIKRIKVSNFKSFRDLEVNLSNFNVFIGANASGKSSFVQIFDFLRNISKNGLSNAISMQGGIEYLRNINVGSDNPLSFEIKVDSPKIRRIEKETDKTLIYREAYETKYNFTINFSNKNSEEFEIIKDELIIKFKYYRDFNKNKNVKEIGAVNLILFNNKGKLDVEIEKKNFKNINNFELKRESIIPPFFNDIDLTKRQLILETPFAFFIEPPLEEILDGISIYNINPTLPKRATPITGKAELEEDGSNLAIVLKNIIENKEKERKFSNLIKDILPFVDKMDVEKFADKSLLFKLKETYILNEYIPASLLSDGTINITALIIALYFEQKKIAIFEEPERNIHPHLISRIVEMFSDASSKKQLIITTHNPEIIKHINLENLFLVHRDKDGFSRITKPVEKEEVKLFLENDMGIDDLYIQNLLEV